MEAGGHEHDDHHHNEKVEVGGVSAVEMMINSTSQTPLPLQLTSTTHQLLAPPCPPPTPPPEHLCYVRCNFCSTVLAVVIPCKRLLDTVTVKCGHCSNLSFLSTRPPPPPPLAPPPPLTLPLTLPSANINSSSSAHHPGIYQSQQQRLDHPQLSLQGYNFMEKAGGFFNEQKRGQSSKSSSSSSTEQLSPPASFVVKPPEKKHRLPSAYNRFMKEEIQRIKAANPEIPHREAFSAAAKNWARYIPNPAGSVSDTNKRSLN